MFVRCSSTWDQHVFDYCRRWNPLLLQISHLKSIKILFGGPRNPCASHYSAWKCEAPNSFFQLAAVTLLSCFWAPEIYRIEMPWNEVMMLHPPHFCKSHLVQGQLRCDFPGGCLRRESQWVGGRLIGHNGAHWCAKKPATGLRKSDVTASLTVSDRTRGATKAALCHCICTTMNRSEQCVTAAISVYLCVCVCVRKCI